MCWTVGEPTVRIPATGCIAWRIARTWPRRCGLRRRSCPRGSGPLRKPRARWTGSSGPWRRTWCARRLAPPRSDCSPASQWATSGKTRRCWCRHPRRHSGAAGWTWACWPRWRTVVEHDPTMADGLLFAAHVEPLPRGRPASVRGGQGDRRGPLPSPGGSRRRRSPDRHAAPRRGWRAARRACGRAGRRGHLRGRRKGLRARIGGRRPAGLRCPAPDHRDRAMRRR